MKKKIKDNEAFNVDKYCKSATRGPAKKKGQRVIFEDTQTKFPWYYEDDFPDLDYPLTRKMMRKIVF